MPLFRAYENRWINVEHVADIKYTRGGTNRLTVRGFTKQAPQETETEFPSMLEIVLLNKDVISLRGEDADEAWEAFGLAQHEVVDPGG
jgi:hypothetical protein